MPSLTLVELLFPLFRNKGKIVVKKMNLAFLLVSLLCLVAPAKAATYTINHGLCVNATSTINIAAKDCGGIPLFQNLNLSDLSSPSTARTNLGLTIGGTVQAWGANLDGINAGVWGGATSIFQLGTITTGIWNGTAINNTYIASGLDASKLTTGVIPNARITALPNANLANSVVTINTHNLSLGSSLTLGFSDFAGSVSAAQLPNPGASSLGGIQSIVATSHQWINSISTSGVPAKSQPAMADISDYVYSTTWSPTDTSGSSGVTLTVGNAKYSQAGGQVLVRFYISWNNNSDTHAVSIGNFPLPASGLDAGGFAGSCLPTPGIGFGMIVYISAGASQFQLFRSDNSAAVTNQMMATNYAVCTITIRN